MIFSLSFLLGGVGSWSDARASLQSASLPSLNVALASLFVMPKSESVTIARTRRSHIATPRPLPLSL